MDHVKKGSLCFARKNKNINIFMKILVILTSMFAHGYSDMKFAYFCLNLYLGDSSYRAGLVAKHLCDLEKPHASSLGVVFENSKSTLLVEVVLKEKLVYALS
jgi:hypothetical protein